MDSRHMETSVLQVITKIQTNKILFFTHRTGQKCKTWKWSGEMDAHTMLAGDYISKALWRTFQQFLLEFKIYMPYDPSIPFLSICPRETLVHVQNRQCTRMLLEVRLNGMALETFQQSINGKQGNHTWCNWFGPPVASCNK